MLTGLVQAHLPQRWRAASAGSGGKRSRKWSLLCTSRKSSGWPFRASNRDSRPKRRGCGSSSGDENCGVCAALLRRPLQLGKQHASCDVSCDRIPFPDAVSVLSRSMRLCVCHPSRNHSATLGCGGGGQMCNESQYPSRLRPSAMCPAPGSFVQTRLPGGKSFSSSPTHQHERN